MDSVGAALAAINSVADKPLVVRGAADIGGHVTVQGGKNTANKLIAATIAVPGRYTFTHFPLILDPLELLKIAEFMGAIVTVDADSGVVTIDTRSLVNKSIPYAMTRTTTSAFGFAGGLLGRFGKVHMGKPGGDTIGARPIDLHVSCFEQLGATVHEGAEELQAQLAGDITAKRISLALPSTGAAVNAILAVVANGATVTLANVPPDTDIFNMYAFLEKVGVVIGRHGGSVTIDATGVTPQPTVSHACAPDRNDCFTWMAYGALSRRGLTINNVDVADMQPGITALRDIGVDITEHGNHLLLRQPATGLRAPSDIVIAGLSPNVHSDWAPLLEVVLTTIPGRSQVIDTAFSRRIRQAELLQHMGADIKISGGSPPAGISLKFSVDPNEALYKFAINGPAQLHGVKAAVGNDVRACAAAVLAGSIAQGDSTFSDIRALYRGYEKIAERLAAIGVEVTA